MPINILWGPSFADPFNATFDAFPQDVAGEEAAELKRAAKELDTFGDSIQPWG